MIEAKINPVNEQISKHSESFLLKINCISNPLTSPQNIQNLSIKNLSDQPKEKNVLQFLIRKRGRKSKDSENINSNTDNAIINSETYIHGKYSNDNIRRKIKSLYHKYIISLLNSLIKKRFNYMKRKFVKMSKKTTIDLGIEYNRNLFNQCIKDIIINVSNKYLNPEINKSCIKFILKQKDNDEIIKILNTTYRDLFTNYYLKSTKNDLIDNSFEIQKEMLLKKYGKDYLTLFIKNAENFIEFYINGKNRKLRKPQEVKIIDIPLENDNSEIKISEALMENNCVNNDKRKKMVSSSIQTDICGINKKLISFY